MPCSHFFYSLPLSLPTVQRHSLPSPPLTHPAPPLLFIASLLSSPDGGGWADQQRRRMGGPAAAVDGRSPASSPLLFLSLPPSRFDAGCAAALDSGRWAPDGRRWARQGGWRSARSGGAPCTGRRRLASICVWGPTSLLTETPLLLRDMVELRDGGARPAPQLRRWLMLLLSRTCSVSLSFFCCGNNDGRGDRWPTAE
jgi:hypothetical protein